MILSTAQLRSLNDLTENERPGSLIYVEAFTPLMQGGIDHGEIVMTMSKQRVFTITRSGKVRES